VVIEEGGKAKGSQSRVETFGKGRGLDPFKILKAGTGGGGELEGEGETVGSTF
jgi:hypothetical protein